MGGTTITTEEALSRLLYTARQMKERAALQINDCKNQIHDLEKQISLHTGERDYADAMITDIEREIKHL